MTKTTIGEQLRASRLAQNLDLSQIADETKISKYYLEAIEANQVERLPGLFFYKAFVRQYSKLLKLDAKRLETEIDAEHGAPDVSVGEIRQSRLPVFRREPALRAANSVGGDMRLVLAAAGLIAVLVGGSVVYTWSQRPAPTVVTESRPVYTTPAAATSKTAAAASVQSPSDSGVAGMRQVSDNLTPEAGPDSNVSLSLSATEPTWITITSDGRTVYTGILEPQHSKSLAGRQKVMIKVGNAAGLEVKWNGKPIGKLGDAKQVRTILFTDKDFQIVKPIPAAASTDPVSD